MSVLLQALQQAVARWLFPCADCAVSCPMHSTCSSSIHTAELLCERCRFIVENYNLRYLMNEVEEKDKLHPVALPAFPSTAPTGHVRRQVGAGGDTQ